MLAQTTEEPTSTHVTGPVVGGEGDLVATQIGQVVQRKDRINLN